jgi:hypothetical protein
MVGFMCHVSGKLDPSEFFYGLQLNFDGPPHMVQLRTAIEARVMADNVLPDGGEYYCAGVEILDMRVNLWVPLDHRHQLYSGCHITALRDVMNATAAGQIEQGHRRAEEKVAALGVNAQQLFDALDYDNAGVVSLKALLRVLRHDVNYAIDLFSAIDERSTGRVTFQDFTAAYHRHPRGMWTELHSRLQHGGKLPGGEASLLDGAPREGGSEAGGDVDRVVTFGSPERRGMGSASVLDTSATPMSTRMDLLSQGMGAAMPAIGSPDSVTLADIRVRPTPRVRPAGPPIPSSSPRLASVVSPLAAVTTPGGSAEDLSQSAKQGEVNRARAASVVAMFQGGVKSRPASKIGRSMLAAAREMKKRGTGSPAAAAPRLSPPGSSSGNAAVRSPLPSASGNPGIRAPAPLSPRATTK